MWSYARANVRITNDKNKRKIPMRASRGLKWENKMYKLKRSILRHPMYHHHINRAIYHDVKLIVDLVLIPYLWFGMSDSSTTQCDVISSFCRHVLRWRDNRRLGPFGFRWLHFSWRGWNKMMKQHFLEEKLIPCATIKKIRNIYLSIIIAMAKVWASFKNSG